MAKKKNMEEEPAVSCPVGKIFQELHKVSRKKPEFMEHLLQSRLEFLKAIKCLLDSGIERLEKQGDSANRKKAVKIDVE